MKTIASILAALLLGCSHSSSPAPAVASRAPSPAIAGAGIPTPHPDTLPLSTLTWTPFADPTVISRTPTPSWIDVLAFAPASPAHRDGTALVVTLADAGPPGERRVTLYEWDAASRAVARVLQLPGNTRSVRSARRGGELVIVRVLDGEQAELLFWDASLTTVRRRALDLGPHPNAIAIAANTRNLVVVADIAAAVDAPSTRMLSLDADGAVRAQRDVYGGLVFEGMVRHDPVVLRDDRVYVLAHDPAEVRPSRSLDRPLSLGALGVFSFDAATLEPIAARMADIEVEARAGLYLGERGVLLVSEETVSELDWDLRRSARSRSLVGPILGASPTGGTVGVPARLRRASENSMQHTCIPASSGKTVVYACTTLDEHGQGALTLQR